MKTMVSCMFWLLVATIFCTGIVCVKNVIADVYNTCLLRVSRAAFIRDKMRLCVQKKYKTLLPDISSESLTLSGNNDDNNFEWFAVKSEIYGPKREPKKKCKKNGQSVARKNRNTVNQENVQQELLTHRSAPFSLPLAQGSFWISSRFGPRRRPDGSPDFHYGLDLAANKGTPIYAARTGVVVYAGWDNGYGNTILIKHGTHFKTRYAHLDRIFIKIGDTVARGVRIGSVGATGHIRKKGGDGSHLHFEVHYRGKRVDPVQFLPDIVS